MSPWYMPSLLPLLALSGALGLAILWRDRTRWPVAAHCLSLTAWCAAIYLAADPSTRALGERLLMVGFFVPATFLHVAARELSWRTRAVPVVYGLGALMFGSSLAVGGLYLDEGGTAPGLLFWPMFLLSGAVGLVPVALLARAPSGQAHSERRRYLTLAGLTTLFGGALNNLLMLAGLWLPLGLYFVLLSIGLLTYVVRSSELPSFGRFVERSQRYTLLAAIMSTLWMFALVATVQGSAGWSWQAMTLLFVLTLTAQPLFTEARSLLAGAVFPGQEDAEGLTRALAQSEARAEHAERLAELGVLTAAVAHEVRNPLGVIAACAGLLEREGANPDTLEEIRAQVRRASEFADDLLEYGRPSELRVRPLELSDAARMAASEIERAEVGGACAVTVEGRAQVQADLSQVVRLLGVLFENAQLAGAEHLHVLIRTTRATAELRLVDDGPGVPEALTERLFEPFVTGRARRGPRPGTGLGLAIAKGIAERHRGTLRLGQGQALPGACFVLTLPLLQPSAPDPP